MPVNEKTQTAEEKKSAGTSQVEREDQFAKKLIGQFDLSAGLADSIKDAEKKETQKEEEEALETEEETQEEESSEEESSENSEEESGEAEVEIEEDEELTPEGKKSAKKRIDELVKKNKLAEAELKRLRTLQKEEKPEPAEEEEKDADQKTLNRLASQPDGVAKLRNLKREVMAAWKAEPDQKKADAYLDLQEKIDATISSIPQRFQQTQVKHFQAAMRSTAENYGEKLTDKVVDKIAAIAKSVYSKSRTLQSSPTGQAEAWEQAVERYEENQSLTAGKSTTTELKRQNNNLKKKVALDVAVSKGNTDKSEGAGLFKRAKTGNAADKTAFVKKKFNTDSLIPDEYK